MYRDISSTFRYQVLAIGVSIGLSIVAARALGPAGKGELAIVASMISVLSLLLAGGFPTSVTHFVANKTITARKSIRFGLFLATLSAAATAAIVLGTRAAHLHETFFGTASIVILWTIPFAVAISIHQRVSTAVLSSHGLFIFVNRTKFVSSIAMFAAAIGLFAIYGQSNLRPHVYFGVQTFVALLTLGVLAHRAGKTESTMASARPVRIPEIAGYGFRSVGADILQFLSYRLDYWIVAYFLGSSRLGVYTLGVGLAQYLWLLPSAVATVLFPKVSSNVDFDPQQAIRSGRLVLAVALVVGAGGAFFLWFVVPIAYGKDFADASLVYAALCIGVIPFCLGKVHASVIAGQGRVSVNLLAAGIGAIVTVCLDLALIPNYGILGAALASAIAYCSTTAVVVVAIAKSFECSISDLVILKRTDLAFVREKLWNSNTKH